MSKDAPHWRFGDILTEAREEKYALRSEAADALGIKYSSLGVWERGESLPLMRTLCKLRSAFGQEIADAWIYEHMQRRGSELTKRRIRLLITIQGLAVLAGLPRKIVYAVENGQKSGRSQVEAALNRLEAAQKESP